MNINQKLKAEILNAIENRVSESFLVKVSGGLEHFVSSEGQVRGNYLYTETFAGKEYKVYMT